MTIADVTRLFRHWQKFPPTHRLVASYLGVGPEKEADKPQYMDERAFAAVMRATGGRIEGLSAMG